MVTEWYSAQELRDKIVANEDGVGLLLKHAMHIIDEMEALPKRALCITFPGRDFKIITNEVDDGK